MSSSARFVGTVRGAIDGGVIPAVPSAQTAPRQRQFKDERYDALLDVRTQDDPKLRAKVSSLLSRCIELHQEIEEVLTAEADRVYQQLIERHEAAKARCREILKKIEDCKSQMVSLRSQIAEAKNKTTKAYAELHDCKQRRAQLNRFASDAEVTKANSAIDRAQEKATKAQHAEADPTQEHNRLATVIMHQLSEELRQAEGQERDLSLAVTGERGTNSLGFQV